MMVKSAIILDQDLENIPSLIKTFIKDNGQIMNSLDKELLPMLMVMFMKDNSQKENSMDSDVINIKVENTLQVNG